MSMHHVERAAVTDLMPSRKLVFMAICDSADKDSGLGFPGFDVMQEWSGLGKSQVHENVAALIADGYISRVSSGRKGKRAVFRVFDQVACCALHEPYGVQSGTPDPKSGADQSGTPDPESSTGSGIGSGKGPVKGPVMGPVQTGPLPSTQASKYPSTPGPSSTADGDRGFDEFWDAYGKKVDRGHALRAWRTALDAGVAPDVMIAGAKAARAEHDRAGTEDRFITKPARWLGGEGWADELFTPPRPSVQLVEAPPDGLTDAEYVTWQRDQLLQQRRNA